MTLRTSVTSAPFRLWLQIGVAAILTACAQQPTTPTHRDLAPVVAPVATAPVTGSTAPLAGAATATPSLAMPQEWRHHNGEDYDDLFDRMRASQVLAHFFPAGLEHEQVLM